MKKVTVALCLAMLFQAGASFAISGDEALAKFRRRMLSAKKMTGVISWTNRSGQTFSGSFKYMAPDKIYIKFSYPSGKEMVSNGKRLWIYNPASNVCGVQELAYKTTSGGIVAIVNGYNGIAIREPNGYTINLKNEAMKYTEIILTVDLNFMLRRAILKNKDGVVFSFSLSSVSTEATVDPKIFNFKVPEDAQTVRNPYGIQ